MSGSIESSVTFGSSAIKISNSYKNFQSKFIPSGMRKPVTSFSKDAQRKFLWRLQTLDFNMLNKNGFSAFFVTLTYQRDFFKKKRNLRLAKRDLNRFFYKELDVKFDYDWFSFWKMEFHKSGVAHFHLFLLVQYTNLESVLRIVNESWVSAAAFDASNRVKKSMLKASTNVRWSPLSLNKVLMSYVSKEVGKTIQTVDVPVDDSPGRFWGLYKRSVYKKFVREEKVSISLPLFYRLRRDFKRWAMAKGYNFKLRSSNGLSLFFISDISFFERLLVYYLDSY